MPQNFLCGPDGTNRDEGGSASATGSQTGEDAENGRKRRNGSREVASVEQCLRALTQLPGLVAMGMLIPAQSNALRASFATILQHDQKAQTARVAAVDCCERGPQIIPRSCDRRAKVMEKTWHIDV
jgi:hypothetical protein